MLWSRGTSLRAARRSRGQRSPRCSRAARQHAQTFPQGVLSLAAAARATREQQQPAAPEARPLAQGYPLGLRGEPSPLGCRREARAAALSCRVRVADFASVDAFQAQTTRSRIAGTVRKQRPVA